MRAIFLYYCDDYSIPAILSAALMPSNAEEVMPPAYPAPSPQGYKFGVEMDCRVSGSRGMRTALLLLLSTPTMMASLVRRPGYLRSKSRKPCCSRLPICGGNHWSRRLGVMPGR